MGRIVFFILLALAIYIGWRLWKAQRSRSASAGGQRSEGRNVPLEAIVRCDACGLNLPQSEALPLAVDGSRRWYCCEEHRSQGPAR